MYVRPDKPGVFLKKCTDWPDVVPWILSPHKHVPTTKINTLQNSFGLE